MSVGKWRRVLALVTAVAVAVGLWTPPAAAREARQIGSAPMAPEGAGAELPPDVAQALDQTGQIIVKVRSGGQAEVTQAVARAGGKVLRQGSRSLLLVRAPAGRQQAQALLQALARHHQADLGTTRNWSLIPIGWSA